MHRPFAAHATTPSHRLHFMLGYLAAVLVATAGVNWLVDPFGAWGAITLGPAAVDELPTRALVAAELRRQRPTTLLVGTSQVARGMWVPGFSQDGVFNAGLPGASVREGAAIIRAAQSRGTVRRVIWGVEFPVFDVGRDEHGEDAMDIESRLRGDWQPLVFGTLLSFEALDRSRKLVERRWRSDPPPAWPALPVPLPAETLNAWLAHDRQGGTDPGFVASLDFFLPVWRTMFRTYRLSAASLAAFGDAVDAARHAGIDVTVFVPPQSEYEVEAIRQGGQWATLLDWKRRLAARTGYWDFSGYGGIADQDYLFSDAWHFKPGVGHAILRALLGADCSAYGEVARAVVDAGTWVDGATIDAHLTRQDQALARRLAAPSPYRARVAAVSGH